jgi:hypothetical protein
MTVGRSLRLGEAVLGGGLLALGRSAGVRAWVPQRLCPRPIVPGTQASNGRPAGIE